jgi:hypothetical protein
MKYEDLPTYFEALAMNTNELIQYKTSHGGLCMMRPISARMMNAELDRRAAKIFLKSNLFAKKYYQELNKPDWIN